MTAVALEPVAIPTVAARPSSLLRRALRLWRTRVGVALVLVLVAVALLGPLVAPHAPADFVGPPNTGPAPGRPLGTDYLGQDVLSRFMHGGRTLLTTAVVATALGLGVGAAIGLVAAYARNVLDDLLMRGLDVLLAFPQIMLALVAVAVVGPQAWVIVAAIAITTAPRVARVTRAAAQPVVERDFVAAAEALGVPRRRILTGELLPNVLSPLLVEASLRLTYSIGVIASLAFLGLSADPNGADWGVMIQQNRIALSVQPYGVVTPVLALALLTMGTGLIGDGISRAAAGIDRPKAP